MKTELLLALLVAPLAAAALVVILVRWVGTRPARYRALVVATVCLTFVVVVVGAYVRLSDAGLGCPDWPGCYGHIDVPRNAAEHSQANAAYPHMPVEVAKAWKEMGHRYIAGLLGLLILAIAVIAWRRRIAFAQSPWLATSLVAVVAVQATLGMWTVTMLLKPAIVTLHLAGGMTVLALLVWLAMRQFAPPGIAAPHGLRMWAAAALAAVAAQILLGGWVSTNYAALACTDFPLCRGAWMPPMDFANAFHVLRELGMTAQGDLLSNEALTAIHWLHRLGAVVVTAFLVAFAARLWRVPALRTPTMLMLAVLAAQVTMGILNVVLSLPLPLAAAHNGGAAALLAVLVVINFRLRAAPVAVSARFAPASP
jgi:cytochrome c oxidase assembly protein subunit 15